MPPAMQQERFSTGDAVWYTTLTRDVCKATVVAVHTDDVDDGVALPDGRIMVFLPCALSYPPFVVTRTIHL